VLLTAVGNSLGDEAEVGPEQVCEAFYRATGEVQRVGGAKVGDKSMVDVLAPFADSLARSVAAGAALSDSWLTAAEVATSRATATSEMTANVGRARPLGDRSLGSPDPGAVSLALVINAVSAVLVDDEGTRESEGVS
jgi:dihydroxyacetone kinase